MVRVLIAVTGLFLFQPGNQDFAVYQAVAANTIRPEVERLMAVGAGTRTPAPIIAFDRTLMICRPAGDHPRDVGCISDEEIQAFDGTLPGMERLMFDGLLTSASRQELARSFRERNRVSETLAGTKLDGSRLDGFVFTAAEGLDDAIKRESSRTIGFCAFSLPAYSADHAIVYASYVCGGLCGKGWLFLLEHRSNTRRVVSEEMVWIS
jgi:hypothetical protein